METTMGSSRIVRSPARADRRAAPFRSRNRLANVATAPRLATMTARSALRSALRAVDTRALYLAHCTLRARAFRRDVAHLDAALSDSLDAAARGTGGSL
jgi:hypothetical protein